MLYKKLIAVFLASFFVISLAFAATPKNDPPPLVMIKATANKMIEKLDKHQPELKTNDKLVYNIVDTTLVPKFDLTLMAQMVVGRNAWMGATPALHNQFVHEFKRYVIRTYSGAVASYDGEKIKFNPMRNFSAQDKRVQIYSKLLQKNGPPIPISYRLLKRGNNGWMVYDFSIEGVSLVQNYRSQFSGTLNQGGLKKLVEQLKQHNKELKNG